MGKRQWKYLFIDGEAHRIVMGRVHSDGGELK
jgi:hypothetical protein